ncbi:CRTAC1 family protein [Halococcus agarilyticus]|uniref:CRTAC1 family protein n=1 Tax=Halococcus agarilyticus TaxID=1232219 RepID=UPI0006777D7C|nr:CRTAC1 family protein [Halococcus agarilyticus]
MWNRRRQFVALILATLVVLAGCSALADFGGNSDPGSPLTFENATAEAGVAYQGTGEGVGAGDNGIHATDVNNDGWTDLLAVGGDRPALFLNDGGSFERRSGFPNVSAQPKSASVVDYDGDGWDDVLLFVPGDRPIVLHNDGGDFERAESSLGLGTLTYPLGATTADYDGDGDRDLLVYQSGNWANGLPEGHGSTTKQIEADNGNPNVLYENTGKSGSDRFVRATDAGLAGNRWSLAASFVDLTGDGRPDIHVANDYNTDVVYVNQGDGTFRKNLLGGTTARNGMSSEVADVTGDGRPDIFVTNIYLPLEENREEMGRARYKQIERLFNYVVHSGRTKGNTLLVNQGNGTFVGKAPEYNVQHGGWGWAASMTDFDSDGDRDLIHATQALVRINRSDPVWTLPMVWQRNETGFSRVDKRVHGMAEHNSRGMTTLDYDHDGDVDLVMAAYDGPTVVYENTVEGGHAIQFEVVDESGATALGATVTVEANGERMATVYQTDENDFFSQESRTEHVGLGQATSATLTVTWPDGTRKSVEVDAGDRLRIAKSGVTTSDDGS